MKLTKKQKEVYNLIKKGDKVGWFPTYKEMANIIGVSKHAIKQRLDGVIKKGYVEKVDKGQYKIKK